MEFSANPKKNKIVKQLWFLRSIITVALITVTLLFAYSLMFLSPSYINLIEKITEQEAVRIATLMANEILPAKQIISKKTFDKNFSAHLANVAVDIELIKVKLFAPDGETIFSTEASDIGVMNTKDYFHSVVKKGSPFTKIVKKNSTSLENQLISVDVVETYVPIMNQGNFLGAFEIYLDITDTVTRIERLMLIANLILLTISIGLLLAMIIIVAKAKSNLLARQKAEDKIIQQNIAIQQKNDALSLINAISYSINESMDLDSLLAKVKDTLASRLGTADEVKGIISTYENNKINPRIHFGYDDDFLKKHKDIDTEKCLCGLAIKNGEIIISQQAERSAQTLCEQCAPNCHIVIPLINRNKVLGVLSLHVSPDVNLKYKKDIFQTIGNQLGLAISNANLFMETEKHSLLDPLTGLGNRRNLEQQIGKLISETKRSATSFSLAMIDIDFFKKYNDTYGHDHGDKILQHVAQFIQGELRDVDFAARFGGEEFIVIFPMTNIESGSQACERIRQTIEKETDVTVSIGVSEYLQGTTADDLIKSADKALYAAKENGRNRLVVG